MKKKLLFLPAVFLLAVTAMAQERDLLDMDFDFLDSIFDEPQQQETEQPSSLDTASAAQDEAAVSIIDSLRRRGFDFDFSYVLRGAVNPGWVNVYPWEPGSGDHFSLAPAVSMVSSIGINAQISSAFRVRTVISMEIPGAGSIGSGDLSIIPNITLGDFYFDYNFFERVYLRAGKYEQPWGISPNFGFTNLLSRVPASGSGPSYLVKFDVPAGVGGFQLLAQTRANIAKGEIPGIDSIGFGGKFNLAFQWADFNIGAFYQGNMPVRAFFTAKTTLWDFEIYSEWLAVFNTQSDNAFGFACNIGFVRSFFDNRLDVNAELFYNGEGISYSFRPETDFDTERTSPFINGVNTALNLLYRFDGWGSVRFFTRFLYADNSFSITPGIRITPFSNFEVYLALPVALGNGYYKTSSAGFNNEVKPFSVLLYVTLKGDLRAGYYY